MLNLSRETITRFPATPEATNSLGSGQNRLTIENFAALKNMVDGSEDSKLIDESLKKGAGRVTKFADITVVKSLLFRSNVKVNLVKNEALNSKNI